MQHLFSAVDAAVFKCSQHHTVIDTTFFLTIYYPQSPIFVHRAPKWISAKNQQIRLKCCNKVLASRGSPATPRSHASLPR